MWRTDPTCRYFVPPGPYTATHVAYDYVKLLLAQLNKGKTRYRVVAVEPEFDFETDANTDGSSDHSCDEDVRLTMRDAILARVGAGVTTKHIRTGHYKTLIAPKLAGLVTVPVTRGWLSADVKVRGGCLMMANETWPRERLKAELPEPPAPFAISAPHVGHAHLRRRRLSAMRRVDVAAPGPRP